MAEEYNLPIGADISSLLAQMTSTKTVLGQVNEAGKQVGVTLKQSFNAAEVAASKMQAGITSTAGQLGKQRDSVAQLTDAILSYQDKAFGERDIQKVAGYNKEIEKLKLQLQHLTRAGTKGFDDMGRPIKAQMGQLEKLRALAVLYKNGMESATRPENLEKYRLKLQQTEAAIGRMTNAGKVGFDELGNKIKQTTSGTDKFLGSIRNIGAAIGISFGVAAIFAFGKEVVTLSAGAEGVQRAFLKLNSPALLENLRKATRGTVSDLNLMKAAINANNFQIPIEKLGSLLKFAQERARDTGQSVDYLVESIVTGIARKSPLILDNLGLNIQRIQKEFARTGDFAKAAFTVVDEELAKSGARAMTTADQLAVFSAIYENFKVSIGANTSGVINYIAEVSSAYIGWLNLAIKDTDQRIGELAQKYAAAGAPVEQFRTDDGKGRAAYLRGLELQIAEAQKVFERIDQDFQGANILQTSFGTITEKRDRAKLYLEELKATQVLVKGVVEDEAKARKAASDKEAADWEAGRAKREAQAKKELEYRKMINDRLVALYYERQQAIINQITDEGERAVRQEEFNRDKEIAFLRKEAKEKPELAGAINKLIEQKHLESAARLMSLFTKQKMDQLKLEEEANEELDKLFRTEEQAQLAAIDSKYKKILEKTRAAGLLTSDMETKLNAQRDKERGAASLKIQTDLLKAEEELLILSVEARKRKEGQTEVKYEEQKQIDILEIKLKYAKLQLAAIDGNPAQVKEQATLKKIITEIENALSKATKKKPVDFLEFLGLDPEKVMEIADAASRVGSVASDLFAGLAEGVQLQIDQKQKLIDALTDQLDEQEDIMEKEKELMEQGFANNYGIEKKKYDALKAQREQAVKDQEAMQKKQQALQRAQIIADGIAQVSNLITASTDIFKSLAKFGPFGVAAAIATIGVMFGGFVLAKANAIKATKMEKGGKVKGKLHSDGGNKYVSADGNDQDIIEIEKDEFVTNRKSTAKHEKLLNAINKDDFSGLSVHDQSIKDLLAGTGVSAQAKKGKDAARTTIILQDRAEKARPTTDARDGYLHKISKGIDRMNKHNEAEPTVIDMGDYIIIKTGTVTERRWK